MSHILRLWFVLPSIDEIDQRKLTRLGIHVREMDAIHHSYAHASERGLLVFIMYQQ